MLLSSFYSGTIRQKLITYPPDNGNSFLDYLDNNQAGLLITTDQPQGIEGEALIQRGLHMQPTLHTILPIKDQPSVNQQNPDFKIPIIVVDKDMLTNSYPFRAALLAAIGNAACLSLPIRTRAQKPARSNLNQALSD